MNSQERAKFINVTIDELDQPIFDAVFSLGCFTADKLLASGTAVVIAPHLAITAKHVIEDYLKQFENIDADELYKSVGNNTSKISEALINLAAVQYQNGGKSVNMWRVQEVYLCLHTDIAFLFLMPFNEEAKNFNWLGCKIDLLPPKIGEKVFGFGFHSSLLSGEVSPGTLSWKDTPATTIGNVIEHHLNKRDSSRLNFPCFQTDARFDGGMSGGPVFNEAGNLCGIICSTLPSSAENESHVSYVSLIWPSFITQINIPYPELEGKAPYPLLLLAQMGFIEANGFERVKLIHEPGYDWYRIVQFVYPN